MAITGGSTLNRTFPAPGTSVRISGPIPSAKTSLGNAVVPGAPAMNAMPGAIGATPLPGIIATLPSQTLPSPPGRPIALPGQGLVTAPGGPIASPGQGLVDAPGLTLPRGLLTGSPAVLPGIPGALPPTALSRLLPPAAPQGGGMRLVGMVPVPIAQANTVASANPAPGVAMPAVKPASETASAPATNPGLSTNPLTDTPLEAPGAPELTLIPGSTEPGLSEAVSAASKASPEMPLAPAERTGKRLGGIITQFLETYPQYQDEFDKLNPAELRRMIDSKLDILPGFVKDKIMEKSSPGMRQFLEFVESLPESEALSAQPMGIGNSSGTIPAESTRTASRSSTDEHSASSSSTSKALQDLPEMDAEFSPPSGEKSPPRKPAARASDDLLLDDVPGKAPDGLSDILSEEGPGGKMEPPGGTSEKPTRHKNPFDLGTRGGDLSGGDSAEDAGPGHSHRSLKDRLVNPFSRKHRHPVDEPSVSDGPGDLELPRTKHGESELPDVLSAEEDSSSSAVKRGASKRGSERELGIDEPVDVPTDDSIDALLDGPNKGHRGPVDLEDALAGI